ncbi:MAG: methyltransferase domain-containing protein [Actinomycetota bacterium]|nr:methyltransferase domain-containing protein [Actinomycetota bacterium]
MPDFDSGWEQYAEVTAGRPPLPFFDVAVAKANGDHGDGRLVVDLGSGGGVEARAFLERGWRVFAVDAEPRAVEVLLERTNREHLDRLETAVGRFTDVTLPQADLVYASLSLPFAVDDFEESIASALAAVRPGGWFIGVLLGPHDTWADQVATVDRSDIARLFTDFENLDIDTHEFDGPSGIGPKHWHWHVISARKPS